MGRTARGCYDHARRLLCDHWPKVAVPLAGLCLGHGHEGRHLGALPILLSTPGQAFCSLCPRMCAQVARGAGARAASSRAVALPASKKSGVTHTGAKFEKDDSRNVRFAGGKHMEVCFVLNCPSALSTSHTDTTPSLTPLLSSRRRLPT